MTRILSPGKPIEGFATLDALMAILVLSIALAGIAGWVGSFRRAAIKREARLESILLEAAELGERGWYYGNQENLKE